MFEHFSFIMKNLWNRRRKMNNTVSLIESISFRWYALLILSRILMKNMIYYSIINHVKHGVEKCKIVCPEEEYMALEKAFFDKENNLRK